MYYDLWCARRSVSLLCGTYLLLQLGVAEGECAGVAVLGAQPVRGTCVDGLHQVLVDLVLRLLVLVAGVHSDPVSKDRTIGGLESLVPNIQ